MTTIKLTGGDLGPETMLVRCNLAQAASPVEVNYCVPGEYSGWDSTQYQCADARHTVAGLAASAKRLAASAVEMRYDDFDCDWETVEE